MADLLQCRLLARKACRALLACAAVWAALAAAPRPAAAQLGLSIPSAGYFGALPAYYDGDFRDSLKDFQDEARGGIKAGTNRWIDSICSFTMLGESYYQLGQHQLALVQYTSALNLFHAFNNWMIQVRFAQGIRPANAGEYRPLPWGRSARNVVLGHFPDTTPIMQGQIMTTQQLVGQAAANGGTTTVSSPIEYSVHVQEVIRCTTLAMRRRRELMGPACAQDQLTNDLITALARRPGPPSHWSECWIDLQLGIAYSCGGKDVQAKASLERAVLAAGEFDHPLTGVAFLELGRLALLAADYNSATNYFAEASYAAAMFGDPIVVEEAIRYGQLTHLMANKPGVFPPLAAVTVWAKANNLRYLNVSAQVLAAENYCVLGEPQTAGNLLASAAASIGRRGMALAKIGARLNFVTALAAYQQGNTTLGDQKLAQAMSFQKNGSLKLFHIALADTLYVNGTYSPRVAMDLYGEVLRDPTATDWATDPLESLSVMMNQHDLAYEHWFEVAIDRKDHERVLEISDLARRHRFLSTLEFGGRLHNLRWLLEGPEDNLNQEARLERQDLLTRYSNYDKLHQQAQQLHEELKQLPLVAEDAAAGRAQADKLAKLTALSDEQELLLRQIAVRREPCSLSFPPCRTTKDIKASLRDGQAILSFYSTPRQSYAILMTRDKYGYWKVPKHEQLLKPVMKLLQSLGSVDANRQMTLKELNSANWKEPAKQILDALTKESRADFKSFKELVIVPDGALWYLPFEALPITDGDEQVPLINRVQIRYSPLVSLAVGDPRPRRAGGHTAVVVGKLIAGGDAAQSEDAFEEIGKALPGTVALRPPLPHDMSAYSTLFDGLIVLNEVPLAEEDPYQLALLPHDQKNTGALGSWFSLPWGGPDFIVLPSFHTAAERAIKKTASEPGNEVFLSVCALMANGARTVLLSRWRTGGQSSAELVREFVQELPHAAAADAWQRSLLLVSANPLNPEGEPRLRLSAREEAPAGDHPFFWAGYLLADTGTLPQELAEKLPAQPPEAPAGDKPPAAGNNFGAPGGAGGAAAGANPGINQPGAPQGLPPGQGNMPPAGRGAPATPFGAPGGAGGLAPMPNPQQGPMADTDGRPEQAPPGKPQRNLKGKAADSPDALPNGVVPTNPWADEPAAGAPQDRKSRAKKGKAAKTIESSTESFPEDSSVDGAPTTAGKTPKKSKTKPGTTSRPGTTGKRSPPDNTPATPSGPPINP